MGELGTEELASLKPWARIEAVNDNNTVTWYTIRLKTRDRETIHSKRFKDFQNFDKFLRSKPTLARVLPQLPDAGLFGLRHKLGIGDFNEKGKMGLQVFLNALMEHVDHSDLESFLSMTGI